MRPVSPMGSVVAWTEGITRVTAMSVDRGCTDSRLHGRRTRRPSAGPVRETRVAAGGCVDRRKPGQRGRGSGGFGAQPLGDLPPRGVRPGGAAGGSESVQDGQRECAGEQGAGRQAHGLRADRVRPLAVCGFADPVDAPDQQHRAGGRSGRGEGEHGCVGPAFTGGAQYHDDAAQVREPGALQGQTGGAHRCRGEVRTAGSAGASHRSATSMVASTAIDTMPHARSLTMPAAGSGAPSAIARCAARHL
jgi:hypothetical protein